VDRDWYLGLRSKLSFEPRLAPTLAIVLFDAILVWGAAKVARVGAIPGTFMAACMLAIVLFNAFSILHECGHGSASRYGWINTLLGHAASTFCFIPFFPWKYIHQKHHAWTGNLAKDPVLKSLRTWKDSSVPWLVRACWRCWIPLGAMLQHVVYLSYPFEMWKAGEMTRTKAIRSVVSLLWLLVSSCFAVVAALVWLGPASVVLALILFFAAEELVNIPHHVDMPVFDQKLPIWGQYAATRSCYYPVVISELCVLNFNFHIEHHLFPSLPWYRLRRARALVREALGASYQEAVGVRWNFRNRKRGLDVIVARYRTP